MKQAGFGGDIGKSTVAVILEKMRSRFLSSRKTFEAPAVDEENVQPAVVIVIVESDAATGGFEKILLVLRPDSRATFRKVTPRSFAAAALVDCSDAVPRERNAGSNFFGSAMASTFSSGSTLAERLSDWRNARRVEVKSSDTFPCEPRARIRRFLL